MCGQKAVVPKRRLVATVLVILFWQFGSPAWRPCRGLAYGLFWNPRPVRDTEKSKAAAGRRSRFAFVSAPLRGQPPFGYRIYHSIIIMAKGRSFCLYARHVQSSTACAEVQSVIFNISSKPSMIHVCTQVMFGRPVVRGRREHYKPQNCLAFCCGPRLFLAV